MLVCLDNVQRVDFVYLHANVKLSGDPKCGGQSNAQWPTADHQLFVPICTAKCWIHQKAGLLFDIKMRKTSHYNIDAPSFWDPSDIQRVLLVGRFEVDFPIAGWWTLPDDQTLVSWQILLILRLIRIHYTKFYDMSLSCSEPRSIFREFSW
jgi:hypothetical protein